MDLKQGRDARLPPLRCFRTGHRTALSPDATVGRVAVEMRAEVHIGLRKDGAPFPSRDFKQTSDIQIYFSNGPYYQISRKSIQVFFQLDIGLGYLSRYRDGLRAERPGFKSL